MPFGSPFSYNRFKTLLENSHGAISVSLIFKCFMRFYKSGYVESYNNHVSVN